MKQLTGHIAVVSGGLGDIGKAIALELAERGAAVAISDIRPESDAEPLLLQLSDLGVMARYDVVDVSDPDAVVRWYQTVAECVGEPDLIVPNAAIVSLVPIRELTPEQWRRELQVNLDGAFFMAQEGARRIVEAGVAGRIVFIGSWVGFTPQTHIPAYCVSKAGLRMLCKVLALDLAPHGILVNEVAPGNVDAGLSARIFELNPEWRERNLKRVPIGEMSQATEVAYQVAHLCDPANRQMTGSVILMDGGLSLMSGPNP